MSSKKEFETFTQRTIRYYDQNAQSFWEGTKNHDVTQNCNALLSSLSDRPGLRILDLGCGPGRDLLYFKKKGHLPTGLDGSEEMCKAARIYSGCPVLHQNFLTLELAGQSFEGIFANASLFHVPTAELPRVLLELYRALRPGGVLFSSNPRGKGEGWAGDRFAAYFEWETYSPLLLNAGFEILSHYYRPQGKPLEEQPWLAIVSRRPGGTEVK